MGVGGGGEGRGGPRISDFFYKESKSQTKIEGGGGQGGARVSDFFCFWVGVVGG